MENDKPFVCSISDCGMRFANEDHLTVHKQKHELFLGLTPTTGFKASFLDQTPTPTRFFSALEPDLFNELHNDNPFDVTFRRANSLVAANGEMPIMSENTLLSTGLSNLEPLNTPSIILPSEEPPPLTKIKSVISLKQPTPRIEISNSGTEGKTLSSSSPKAEKQSASSKVKVTDETKLERNAAPSTNLSLDEDKLAQAFEQTIRDTVVQTPVITSVGNLTKANATCVPTAVVVTRTCTNSVPTLTSSVNQIPVMSNSSQSIVANNIQKVNEITHAPPVLQFVIRLSDGQSMPVAFPLAISSAVVPTPPSQIGSNLKSDSNISQIQSAPRSSTKKKLKEVLKSQRKLQKSSNVVMEGTSTSVLLNNSTFSQNESESPPSSPISVGRPSASRRRRRTADDPEERRKKSLERNRAAATRCRQKRKQWITSLESKATEMAKLNLQLQQEVTMLRKEVAQLKTMLLAHKDCPVTQQQAASNFIEVVPVPMVNHTAQREVPQVSISSVPLSELMDVETSSSQSGYISDTSEISTRDR